MDFLNFEADDSLSGFRLKQFELLNWGTFNNIFKITPDGYNSLLTGDVGSGKSTIVDAITTLLVPHNKIVFNKAAGAERKERSIYSYIRGEYRSEKSSEYNVSKSVYLRDEKNYTVLLGVFYNSGYMETVTLAEVFYLRGTAIEKFFIIAKSELSIEKDFTGFGSDIKELRKKLRDIDGLEIFETFSNYSSKFRAIFGIKSEKALDLFFHTVSLKSIGNLTDFVRDNMLEKEDTEKEVNDLLTNFANLTRAHEAVIKAREQITLLNPIRECVSDYEKHQTDYAKIMQYLEFLPLYFIEKKILFSKEELNKNKTSVEELNNSLNNITEKIKISNEEHLSLIRQQQSDSDALRLNEIEYSINRFTDIKNRKSSMMDKYNLTASKLGIKKSPDETTFYATIKEITTRSETIPDEISTCDEEATSLTIQKNEVERALKDDSDELTSLRSRATQIPYENISLRDKICRELKLKTESIPFAAELIRVKIGEEKWEGAIERILHNFGLSLLVSEENYKKVSNYINTNNLKTRIVYFKVDITKKNNFSVVDVNNLISKIDIKKDSEYFDWINSEINSRFNYICCDSMDLFYKYPFAVTPEGLIKSGNIRHEKDDRKNIFDRRNYILGWDNRRKIKLLEDAIDIHSKKIVDITKSLTEVRINIRKLNDSLLYCRELISFNDYNDINWDFEAKEIIRLQNEKVELEKSSQRLKLIGEKINTIVKHLDKLEKEKGVFIGQLSVCNSEIVRIEKILDVFNKIREQKENELSGVDKTFSYSYFETRLNKFDMNSDNIVEIESNIREGLQKNAETLQKQINSLSVKSVKLMMDFNSRYPEDTISFSADISFRDEYIKLAKRLEKDDLPKFEIKFKSLLKEKTIQSIALFKQKLELFASNILDKINNINKSLREIEYNTGTYIVLEADDSTDVEIREFKEKLKKCLENTAGETDLYTEEKFHDVKLILDKFNNADSFNWTNRVIDIRNWFTFNARERWINDDQEKEFYSDSSGKSGGQKEKLAYTILASALAYQFGLEWNTTKSRSFRFAVIDEAFSRGSDVSVKYGLELFKKLNLQLLLITPLQKINVIEQYINTLHVVSNNDEGSSSKVVMISRDDYSKRKLAGKSSDNIK